MPVLFNAASAVLDPAKLYAYVLNPDHPVGRNKARVFRSVLGVTEADAAMLEAALLAAVQAQEAVLERTDAYGAHHSVEFVLNVGGRSARVRSLWIVRTDEDFPRFVSAFVM